MTSSKTLIEFKLIPTVRTCLNGIKLTSIFCPHDIIFKSDIVVKIPIINNGAENVQGGVANISWHL